MTVSKTSITNSALLEIGVPAILTIDEDSEAARTANTIFDQLLDEELEDHDWTFARSRQQLAAETTAPAFGYTYSHVLPTNPYCLHVLEEINKAEYKLEGRKILSDDTPLQIRFTYRVTDMNELSAAFRRAFVYKLASKLALPLTSSAERKVGMEQLYSAEIAKAKSRDSQQDSQQQAFADEDLGWLNARYTRGD
jgi:hypothetical protein